MMHLKMQIIFYYYIILCQIIEIKLFFCGFDRKKIENRNFIENKGSKLTADY